MNNVSGTIGSFVARAAKIFPAASTLRPAPARYWSRRFRSVVISAPANHCSSDAASDLPRPSKAFCRAAARYDDRVERGAKLPEHIKLVSDIAAHAPRDVADDATTFLDALEP